MEFFIALMVAVGAGGWVYLRVARTTGNNVQSAAIVGGLVGLVVFLIMFFLARTFLGAS